MRNATVPRLDLALLRERLHAGVHIERPRFSSYWWC
jgi:hypothetical protein